MKKIIITLFVCLSCIMIANAQWTPYVVDTLPQRIINGLEVIPIKKTYESGGVYWRLRTSDLKDNLLRFESKYPGGIDYNLNSDEVNEAICDWENEIWETIVPAEIKALEEFNIRLLIDKDGRVFTAEFSMPDETFQKLEKLSKNTLKNLYRNLIKERCKAIKEVDFQILSTDSDINRGIIFGVCGSLGSGNEYTTLFLNKVAYDMFGTFSPWRLPKDEFNRLRKKYEAEMNGREQDE